MRYFDHNATSPLLPEAKAAWLQASDDLWFNPGALYRGSVRSELALTQARNQLADWAGVTPERVIFTGAQPKLPMVL